MHFLLVYVQCRILNVKYSIINRKKKYAGVEELDSDQFFSSTICRYQESGLSVSVLTVGEMDLVT